MTDEPMTTEAPETENVTAGGEEQHWYSSLNDEYRNHPSIQKFSDANGLAKSYLSLESLMGRDKIPVPKDDNDVNAWQMYNKAFNIPNSAEDYKLDLDGAEDAKLDGFKALAHKYHLSNEVAQELLNAHVADFKEYENAKVQAFNAEAENATKQLKTEWGLKYDENIKLAKTFLEKMSADKEEFDYFNEKIGNDVHFIKLLSKMGSSISEGNLGGFEGQASGFTKTPAEAKAEVDKILNDPMDAYWAGSRNRRNDSKYCREHNLTFVPEEERKARVAYVNSLMQMQG
jgi:hypothetical protein